MYWLAAIFALGPAYTIWRWPDTISIEVRDTLVLSGQGGEKITILTLQVGVNELFAEIRRHTEVSC
jgi:hypothetical protein